MNLTVTAKRIGDHSLMCLFLNKGKAINNSLLLTSFSIVSAFVIRFPTVMIRFPTVAIRFLTEMSVKIV
jgi:hypothetical protein